MSKFIRFQTIETEVSGGGSGVSLEVQGGGNESSGLWRALRPHVLLGTGLLFDI